jgi:hypothetical protein
MMYTHMTMTHPQTGVNTDQFGCAVALLPVLLVENARQGRGIQASVDSMRNEVTSRQEALNKIVIAANNQTREIRGEEWNPERLQKPT